MAGATHTEVQHTIRQGAELSGVGLFTGQKATMKLLPAETDRGIVFKRVDLSGAPTVRAHLDFVKNAPRCTLLSDQSASVHMVEHLLSALSSCQIDNAVIELDGPEIPAADGSANVFVELIERAQPVAQIAKRKALKITRPVYWSQKGVHLVALPAEEFRVSYTMHYPQSSLLGSQYYSLSVTRENFKTQIAPCRTFSLYEEILPFIEKGVIKGGGLENALVIKEDQILNPGGARFPDEMVRHKVLDLIGDLSLVGMPILGHIISICSGHASNIAFAKKLVNEEFH